MCGSLSQLDASQEEGFFRQCICDDTSGNYLTIGGLPYTSGVTVTSPFFTFATVIDAFFKLDTSTSALVAIKNTGASLVDVLNVDVSTAIVFVNVTYFV